MAEEVAQEASAAGDWVVMGCPNVVRGGSHLGWASAARMAEAGICSVLSSDYFYPAMLRAAMVLAGRGVLDLPRAWALISTNPAAAAGLADRGAIAEGLRADVVLVDPARAARRRHHCRRQHRLYDRRRCRETFVGSVGLTFTVSVGPDCVAAGWSNTSWRIQSGMVEPGMRSATGTATSNRPRKGSTAGSVCSLSIAPPVGCHRVAAIARRIAVSACWIASLVGRPGTRITASVSDSRARSLILPLRAEVATKSLSTPGNATRNHHRPAHSSACTRGRVTRSRAPLRFLPFA